MTTSRPRPQVKLGTTRIARREDITHDLFLIWLERDPEFTFKPGQYCTIGVDGIERPYSISSAPQEDFIELFVEVIPPPDGVLTPILHRMGVGDSMTFRPKAKGLFTFDPKLPNQLLVCTVTGVVPYISFLRNYLHGGESGHHFYVIQGASYMQEFTYQAELERMADEHPDLITYVPTVSRPGEQANAAWTGQTGRANLIVEDMTARWGLAQDNTLVYTCGHPEMIEDVKARMGGRGFTVKEERFFKQDD